MLSLWHGASSFFLPLLTIFQIGLLFKSMLWVLTLLTWNVNFLFSRLSPTQVDAPLWTANTTQLRIRFYQQAWFVVLATRKICLSISLRHFYRFAGIKAYGANYANYDKFCLGTQIAFVDNGALTIRFAPNLRIISKLPNGEKRFPIRNILALLDDKSHI